MRRKQTPYALRGAVGFALGSAIAFVVVVLVVVVEFMFPRFGGVLVRAEPSVGLSFLSAVALTVGMTLAAAHLRGKGFGWSTLAGAFPFGISFAVTFGVLLLMSSPALFPTRLTGVVSSFLLLALPGVIGSVLLYRYLRVEDARLAPVMLCGFFGFGAAGFLIVPFSIAGKLLGAPGILVGTALGFVAAFAAGGFILGLAFDRFGAKKIVLPSANTSS